MNIDKLALREVAEKALPAMQRLLMMPNDELFDEAVLNVDGDVDAANAFNLSFGPETALALLDENIQLQREKDAIEAVALALRDDMRQAREQLEAAERERIRREHAEWSDATFGDVGPIGPLKHLSKEALEAAADPSDPLEWADMQFLLWDAQRRMGISDEFITRAMIEKLAINKARQWPEPKDGEPRLHIKEQSATVVPEKLPCSVELKPGLIIGKGCKTETLLTALRRRAEYYAELEAMTPEERAKHGTSIEAFKAMLPQPAPVDKEFIPKNLDKALGVVGVALPESKEEFNFQIERWIQRLIDRVIRYADEFKEQPVPVVPEERPADSSNGGDAEAWFDEGWNACRAAMLNGGKS
ncbi:DUF550 domain-containing protein [Salmonella enterica subsp. salamae]|nr:DUF550 domain-containing protein [Salmonella enterica subsp. salamae]SQH40172.1 Eaa protein [Salmonella enterica]